MDLKHFLLALISIWGFTSVVQAQEPRLYNTLLKDTSQSYIALGYNNELKLTGVSDLKNYQVVTAAGVVIEAQNGGFNYTVTNENQCVLMLYKDGRPLKEFVFIPQKVGDLKPTGIGSKSDITVAELLANPKLKYEFDHVFDIPLIVISYSMIITHGEETIVGNTITPAGTIDTILVSDPITNEEYYAVIRKEIEEKSTVFHGPQIPPKYLDLIKKLQPNDKILFTNIEVTSPTSQLRSMNSIGLNIVQ